MNVKMKLYSSFAAVIVLCVIMGIYGMIEMQTINDKSTEIVEQNVPRIELASKLNTMQVEFRRAQLAHVIAQTQSEMTTHENELKELEKQVDSLFKDYVASTANNSAILSAQNDWNTYKDSAQQMLAASRENRTEDAMAIVNSSRGLYQKIAKELTDLEALDIQDANNASKEGDELTSRAMTIYTIIMVVLVIVSITIATIISRYISKMLAVMIDVSNKLSSGDFRITPRTITVSDEFGEMANALSDMRANVNKVLKEIVSSAQNVAASSQELTASADQSAQVTQNIAQSISEVAGLNDVQTKSVDMSSAAIEEISASIQEISANANVSNQKAQEALSVADEGGESIASAIRQMNSIQKVVEEAAHVVSELGARSQEIGMIVETITSIAGQTNLLALNAAIEAARAGEHGKGFAVVAEEVRKLAEESQAAAEKIGELISKIQTDTDRAVNSMESGTEEVRRGTVVVENSGESFRKIVTISQVVAEQVDGIARTSEEVAKASTNVIESVKEVDLSAKQISAQTQNVSAATEEQSAAMEEVASSSRSLANIAQTLNDEVQKFKV